MGQVLDALLVLVMLLNVASLGLSRLRAVIAAVAAQGVILGLASLLVHAHLSLTAVVLAIATIGVKGLLIPWMLGSAMREAAIRREVEPLVSYTGSLLLAAAAVGVAVAFSQTLPLAKGTSPLVLPASVATALTGFLVMTTRRKAITQAVGYLQLENGIFVLGLVLVDALPFMVEAGVLLDLFVGIFVMGIIIHRIQQAFSSIDTDRLSELKD